MWKILLFVLVGGPILCSDVVDAESDYDPGELNQLENALRDRIDEITGVEQEIESRGIIDSDPEISERTGIGYCASNPCQHGGICYNAHGHFFCRCSLGYSGLRCEMNTNECASNPCRNGATCVDHVNSFSCKCRFGYEGTLCLTKSAKEEQSKTSALEKELARKEQENRNLTSTIQLLEKNSKSKSYELVRKEQEIRNLTSEIQLLEKNSKSKSYELARKEQEIRNLTSEIQLLEKNCKSKSYEEGTNFNSSSCPTPEKSSSVEFPPQCCSFPFTFNRQLHHRCIPKPDGHYGCLIAGRIWVTCAEPIDFVARNQTVNITIPAVARFTSTSVHNWIVLQQRVISNNKTPFNRSWEEFKVGFGSPDGNFWLGLEKVHKMTNSAPYKLRMEFMLVNGSWYSAEYGTFRVESESQYYRIHVGGYSGDLCDVMNLGHVQNGMNFSTYDRDNDLDGGRHCAGIRGGHGGGGWWYNGCHNFNLNGHYGNTGFAVRYSNSWTYLSVSRMMLKRK